MDIVKDKTDAAACFLKGLASPHRMAILFHLSGGERNVGELIEATNISATSMSQHLAKLKEEGLVSFRREHRTLFYSICDQSVFDIMAVLYGKFFRRIEDAREE
jgi:DNA-binding transcriptional ArsR family regulator